MDLHVWYARNLFMGYLSLWWIDTYTLLTWDDDRDVDVAYTYTLLTWDDDWDVDDVSVMSSSVVL